MGVFMGLQSLIVAKGKALMGKRIQMFSYGSGTAASLFSLQVQKSKHAEALLERMVQNNDVCNRFMQRTKVECDEFTRILNSKVVNDFVPRSVVKSEYFYPDTYYLQRIDKHKQRFYELFAEIKEDEIESKKKNHFPIGDKIMISAQHLLKRAEDNGLSKRGSIKIDQMLHSTQEVAHAAAKCSYNALLL